LKSKCLNILIFIFLSITVFSQALSFKFGEKIPYEKNYKSIGFFKRDGKNLLFQKKTDNSCDFIVYIFNSYLKKDSKSHFLLENHKYVDIIDFLGQIVLFTSYTNQEKEEELRAYLYDNSKGFQLTKVLYKEQNKLGYKTDFVLANKVVNQQLHVLVEMPFQNEIKEEIKYLSFDNHLEIIEEYYYKLDLLGKPKRENDLIVSNNGDVVLIKKFWEKVNNFYVYKLGGTTLNEIKLSLKIRNISAIDYLYNNKNELVISGFFSSPLKYNYEGYFLQKFDEELNLIHKNQYPINEKIKNSFKSSKEIKEGNFGLDNFYITSFRQDTSGNYFLMAEHFGKKKIKDLRYINRKGFVCIKYNKNGSYVWGCPFKTDQLELKNMFGSVFNLNQMPEPLFFYNELKNVGLRKGVPVEFGVNNYCGINQVTFSAAGIPLIKPVKVDFPDSNQQKFAIKPKKIKTNTNHTVYICVDENYEKSMVVLVN
tara:strand:+ start:2721 stop:4160 length:1440 start_codon:yes stop_codon:yes gene_type:complete